MSIATPAQPARRPTTHRRVSIPAVVTIAFQVDSDTGVDASELTTIAMETLRDPRSWEPIKHTHFVLASTWTSARIKVRIRSPKNTDRSCAPFPTMGETSCSRNWEIFINADRWTLGAEPAHMPLEFYRRYVINHEVGHTLGEPHQPCLAEGALASVMLQQTISLDGCLPNPWPNPSAIIVTPTLP